MKYIVEFEDEPCMYEDEVNFYKCIQAPWWGLSERVIEQLTPYQSDAPDTNVGNITNSCAHENDQISRQMAIDALDCINGVEEVLRSLPSAQPKQVCVATVTLTDEQVKEAVEKAKNAVISVIEPEQKWIPCSERLPEDTEPVNITWVNREPEPYYADIKDVPFTATGHYCKGKWYWFSATCQDYLDEYGECEVDAVDNMIEIIAWKPLPEPYRGGDYE